MNINLNKEIILKVAGAGLTVGGSIVSSILSKRQLEDSIQKIVNEKFEEMA